MAFIQKASGTLQRFLNPQRVFNDDVFLVSYPKSGNTWLSFLLANAMCIASDLDVEINFFNIQDFIPEYKTNSRIAIRERGIGIFPRIIKSHHTTSKLFNKVILLVRDPRDVMISYWNYLNGLGSLPSNSTVKQLIFDKTKGIDAWVHHTTGWLQRANNGQRVFVVRYEDLINDTAVCLSEIFKVIGFTIDNSVIEQAVNKSAFGKMRELELASRSPKYALSRSDFRFVRKGTIGNGSDLDKECAAFINEKAGVLLRALKYIEI